MEILRYSSRGPDVWLLQLALTRAGFDPGAIDGIFGAQTLQAVLVFQRAYGLDPDGVAGEQTWRRLMPYLLGSFTLTVQSGDTFYTIAQRYGTTVCAIETANPEANPGNLSVGTRLTVPFGYPVVPDNVIYTYELLQIVLRGLQLRYPFLRLTSVGKSVMGKELYSVVIGQGPKTAMYNASHHGNEWITTPVLLRFLESCAQALACGETVAGTAVQELLQRVTLHVVPMVNPDGVDLVNGAIPADSRYGREAERISRAFPNIPFPSGWKANIAGTDPNLNYPAGWEEARRIKYAQGFDRPAPRDFVGTAPLSAPESRAMYDYTLQQNFDLTISYHTQGGLIFYRYQDQTPPGSVQIAAQMASRSGYAAQDVPYESGFAGYKDWFILQYNRPGFTIEAGRGTNPLPLSDFAQIWQDNVGILLTGLSAAAQERNGE